MMIRKKTAGLLMATMMCSALQGASSYNEFDKFIVFGSLFGGGLFCAKGREFYCSTNRDGRILCKAGCAVFAAECFIGGTHNKMLGRDKAAALDYAVAATYAGVCGRMLWWDMQFAQQPQRVTSTNEIPQAASTVKTHLKKDEKHTKRNNVTRTRGRSLRKV
jgi:hypothetical protein